MARYQMIFDMVQGEIRHTVEIDDDEVIEGVLDEILLELKQRNQVLKGEGEPVQVVCNSKVLDLGTPIGEQGVFPNEVLRVSTISLNG